METKNNFISVALIPSIFLVFIFNSPISIAKNKNPLSLPDYWENQRIEARKIYKQACSGDKQAIQKVNQKLEEGHPVYLNATGYLRANCKPYKWLTNATVANNQKKSAELGYPIGVSNYGLRLIYKIDDGIPRNPKQGVKLMQQALDSGHIKSAITLSELYSKGKYLTKDIKKAQKYLSIAEKAGVDSKHLEKARNAIKAAKNSNIINDPINYQLTSEDRKRAIEAATAGAPTTNKKPNMFEGIGKVNVYVDDSHEAIIKSSKNKKNINNPRYVMIHSSEFFKRYYKYKSENNPYSFHDLLMTRVLYDRDTKKIISNQKYETFGNYFLSGIPIKPFLVEPRKLAIPCHEASNRIKKGLKTVHKGRLKEIIKKSEYLPCSSTQKVVMYAHSLKKSPGKLSGRTKIDAKAVEKWNKANRVKLSSKENYKFESYQPISGIQIFIYNVYQNGPEYNNIIPAPAASYKVDLNTGTFVKN